MTEFLPIVISASRRTDIPAFYMDWFMASIKKGQFEVINPFNRKSFRVPAGPQAVHTLVFWSKDFGLFLEKGHGEILQKMGYQLFFNFTLNSESQVLEPGVPALDKRLDQLEELCRRFDPRSVNLRVDPICFYETKDQACRDNLQDFSRIVRKAADSGVRRCITSFMDHYAKIDKRVKSLSGFRFVDPDMPDKIKILLSLEEEMEGLNMELFTCCEKELLEALPDNAKVKASACVPNDLLLELFGGRLSLKKDSGQRVKQGCGCGTSVDIGSYDLHPCFHNCLFCYANPAMDTGFSKPAGRVQ
ncbi:MAG: DUF1848 domain-containing protein [Proteobacteria bacterium]|nr:DUF1848 domain-containing protein [Pseudomonadota bacterium]MBU4470957.1 DUF1848 domain-containing protein [Pseudomonadota bacterium]MCG2751444.1 DUF1848 domain-containing protein [Desulfobacteraceae bacterium]